MRTFLKLLAVALSTSTLGAQTVNLGPPPTITAISPYWGGVGPNAPGSWTITGTGFSSSPKITRFVDANNVEVFSNVSCSGGSTCTASLRPGYLPAGVAQLSVYALVNGQYSAGKTFLYYAAPVITSLSPNTGPYNASTPYTINGGPFTSMAGGGYPGTTSIYLENSLVDLPNGCGNIDACAATAPSLTYDCCVPQGARMVNVRTVGGTASAYFIYGAAPATPTITAINPSSGPASGGKTVTISGTNFIPGTNSGGGPFGVTVGTTFTFISGLTSVTATGVNCSSTTTCTAVVPAGSGLADIQVYTVCAVSGAACGGSNPRPSVSIPTTRPAAFTYTGIRTNPAPGATLFTSENGQTAQFTVALNTRPTGNVHVAVSTSGGRATPSTSGLDFTAANWSTPQTVTVAGIDDTGVNGAAPPSVGNTSYNVGLLATSSDPDYNDVNANAPAFTNVDNDSKGYFVAPQSGLVTTRAGGAATFTVVLAQQPSDTVIVNVTSNDPGAGTVSPASLTFLTTTGGSTGWNAPRTVTVTGQYDGQPGSPRSYSIIVSVQTFDSAYVNIVPPDVSVTNTDAPPAVTAGPSNQTVNVGQAVSFSAAATAAPAPTVQWQFSSGGASFVDIPGATSTTYSFTASLADSGKLYRALFTNPGGSTATGSATLTVVPTSGPVVTLNPPAVTTVLTGQVIFLSTSATGTPAPTAQWQISSDNGAHWSNFPGATGPNLSFSAERWDNGHQFRVLYTNPSGSSPTSAATLFVRLRVRTDLDNDRKTDLMVWRPGNGYWFWLTSSSSYNVASAGNKQWGNSSLGDVPLSGDLDGDGIMDLVVWRASTGTWFWLTSSSGYAAMNNKQWGNAATGDVPLLGDIDGDGKAELIVWRASSGTWFWLTSTSGYSYASQGQKQWGNASLDDQPMVGDQDGDGLVDLTVWRASTGTWFWLTSSSGYDYAASGTKQWGNAALGDQPLVGDMDGDGQSDLVIWRASSGTFFWLTSSSGYAYASQGQKQWGNQSLGDIPMLADLDGDGSADLVVWRGSSGTWFWLTSSTSYNVASQGQKQWGAAGDIPMIK